MTPHTVDTASPLLAFLFHAWPEVKRTRIKQWLRFGAVRVNDRPVTRHDHPLQPGDVVSLVVTKAPPTTTPLPAGLDLVFENDALLVVHKPAGLLTIATDTERERTAFRLLTRHLRERSRDAKARLWIVHRLDRDTSGLLALAKTEAAKEWLQKHWERMTKTYLAVVEGAPPAAAGTLRSHLDETQPHRVFATARPGPTTREAVTRYRLLGSAFGRSLVELTLETGRRHQIRVQLAEAGCPIVGDSTYGAATDPARRLALHAARLTLLDPETEEERRFESPLPAELARLVPVAPAPEPSAAGPRRRGPPPDRRR